VLLDGDPPTDVEALCDPGRSREVIQAGRVVAD